MLKIFHKYLYANGDPINMTDPSGHEGLGELSVVVGISALTLTLGGDTPSYVRLHQIGNQQVPGVYVCEGWQPGSLIFSELLPSHGYLLIDGVGYGKYSTTPANIAKATYGPGTVKSGDAGVYPVVPTGTTSKSPYAWDTPVYTAGNPMAVHDAIKRAAQNAVGTKMTYSFIGSNCFNWVDNTVDNNGGMFKWPGGSLEGA